MSVSTTLATPLTLVKDQELSILKDLPNIDCWNDSSFSKKHYRQIPNDGSDVGQIKWGNVKSVKRQDGDYAISVSMWDYIPDPITHPFFGSGRNLFAELKVASENGSMVNMPDRGDMYIMPDSVYIENGSGHVIFRKLVWAKNSDLILGSVAQQNALSQAEIDAKKKELSDLANTNPNTANNFKQSNTTGIVVAILLGFFALIWLVVSLVKKKKNTEDINNSNSGGVNVIRIPKNS